MKDELSGYILDKIEIVKKRKNCLSTNFLDPYQQKIAMNILRRISDVNFLTDGGYQGAERQRITLFPDFYYPDLIKSPVIILKIDGNFDFQQVSHRDYLGSLMGLGIKREMIGDLLVLNNFAQVVVAEELKDFIMIKLDRVHQVSVNVSEIGPDELVLPRENTKEIIATVASMRLDAIASAGFGDSRSRIARDIKEEKVKLNWQVENNPARKIWVDDLISINGRGRVRVISENGLSHRGRIKLLLKKYK